MDPIDQRPNIGAGTPLFPGSDMPWSGPAVPARIYRPARAVTQSGPGRKDWVLEFERTVPLRIEPLMGWTSIRDPFADHRLYFPDLKSAVAFAERRSWRYRVEEPPPHRMPRKSYCDRFKYDLRLAMERAAADALAMTSDDVREQIARLADA